MANKIQSLLSTSAFLLSFLLMLSACGGGAGDSGSSGFGGTNLPQVSSTFSSTTSSTDNQPPRSSATSSRSSLVTRSALSSQFFSSSKINTSNSSSSSTIDGQTSSSVVSTRSSTSNISSSAISSSRSSLLSISNSSSSLASLSSSKRSNSAFSSSSNTSNLSSTSSSSIKSSSSLTSSLASSTSNNSSSVSSNLSASSRSSSLLSSSSNSSASSSTSSSLNSSNNSNSSVAITAPTNVQASAGTQAVRLSWNAVSGASSYNVYYSTDSNFNITNVAAFAHGTKLSNTLSPLDINNLTAGLTYYFVVTTVKAGNESNASTKVNAIPTSSAMQVIMFENFDNVTFPSVTPPTAFLYQIPNSLRFYTTTGTGEPKIELIQNAESYGGTGKSLRTTYPAFTPGEFKAPWSGIDIPQYNTNNIYLRFRAKMPKAKHGMKFVKIFGQRENDSYANSTFGLDYTGVDFGGMYQTSFGDGSGVGNDTAAVIGLEGYYNIGRSQGLAGVSILTPQHKAFTSADWGSDWHLFEFYVKFNSGNSPATEKNDGEYQVKIDGKIYVDAKGLFNRHYSNKPIATVEILGWSQTVSGHNVPEFEIWYDNIELSINGWGNNSI